MNAVKALKAILKNNPFATVKDLNKKLGYDSKNAVSQRLSRDNISLDNLLKFANALGYDVVLIPKNSKEYNMNDYVLTNKEMDGESE